MQRTSHKPDEDRWADLGDVLRQAVDQVRLVPPPREAVGRALDRARAIDGSPRRLPPPLPWPGRRTFVLFAGAVAAGLLFTFLSHTGSNFPAGFLVRTWPPAAHRGGATALVPGSLAVTIPGHGPRVPMMGRPRVEGDPADRFMPIGMNELGSRWGTWERVRWPGGAGGGSPTDLCVRATWQPQAADVRLHLIDPDGTKLPAAEIQSGGAGPGRRSRCCVIAEAAPGTYLIDVSLGPGEAPPSPVSITVEVTLGGGTTSTQVYQRVFRLRRPGEHLPVGSVRVKRNPSRSSRPQGRGQAPVVRVRAE